MQQIRATWPELVAWLHTRMGQELACSGWHPVSQDRIDAFAEITEDRQFIHIDPVRAATQGGFGGTVAHGFLTLALMPFLFRQALDLEVEGLVRINYGFNRLRFPAPVPSDSRIRLRLQLEQMQEAAPDALVLHLDTRVECEATPDRPAVVATWLHFLRHEPEQNPEQVSPA